VGWWVEGGVFEVVGEGWCEWWEWEMKCVWFSRASWVIVWIVLQCVVCALVLGSVQVHIGVGWGSGRWVDVGVGGSGRDLDRK
jgi:hypothetical protein